MIPFIEYFRVILSASECMPKIKVGSLMVYIYTSVGCELLVFGQLKGSLKEGMKNWAWSLEIYV